MFKAQDARKETQDAAEVREDADMRVDLPIDQVKILHSLKCMFFLLFCKRTM